MSADINLIAQVKAPVLQRRPIERPVVVYPDSDGEPMAENDPQYWCITDTRFSLMYYYRDCSRVYVGADLLVYYVEGDPTKRVAPDILVSLDVPRGNRSSYQIWTEGKSPDMVFEFASLSTWRADRGWKRGLYQGLGIQEYVLFDPSGKYIQPMLLGYRLSLEEEVYRPVAPLQADRGTRGIFSEVLNLELWARPNGGEGMAWVLRFYDPSMGEWLPTPREETEARIAAEAEIAELQAELARLRAKAPQE